MVTVVVRGSVVVLDAGVVVDVVAGARVEEVVELAAVVEGTEELLVVVLVLVAPFAGRPKSRKLFITASSAVAAGSSTSAPPEVM